LGLITSWLQLNNNSEAVRELNEILADPKNPSQDAARLLLVKVLLSEGKSEDASDALAKISPKSPSSILAEATYWKARLLSVRGKADEARALFEKVIEEGKNEATP
jgi:tetratricopeptide (TPR) repeat protein